MRRVAEGSQLLAPVLLLALVGVVGSFTSRSVQFQFRFALVMATIVIALYVFVGNSGVVSFGHISFVAVGAFAAGLTTVPEALKLSLSPDLFPVIASAEVGNAVSLLLAAAVGGLYALLVGGPLMRLSGLSRGHRHLRRARDYEQRPPELGGDRPGGQDALAGPGDDRLPPGDGGCDRGRRAGLPLPAQPLRPGAARLERGHRRRRRSGNRHLPAAVARLRALGALAGFAGGLLVHLLGSITTQQVYLDLTFITLAMLVIGGVRSLWGAVVGALLVSGVNSLLLTAENGLDFGVTELNVPTGTRLVTLGVVMTLILLFRPRGLTGGREVTLRRS